EFYIGSFLGRFFPSTPFISVSFWGRLIIVLVVAALVRKVGVGMLSLLIFNVLGDLFHYGFGGEPMFTIYETLTYGLFVDLVIAATGGKLFGIGIKGGKLFGSFNLMSRKEADDEDIQGKTPSIVYLLAAVEGAVIGLLWAIPDPIFYRAFFSPFIYGGYVDWGRVIFDLIAYIPGDIVIGIIAALISIRIAKAVGS
ncbi:hypothetical protein, partial [Acidianus sp. RZ1]|uniref:hypothetical protein n=1 Tax=Acidianus sp. RZ1 TaxID=1540082 RepID=UPI0014910073